MNVGSGRIYNSLEMEELHQASKLAPEYIPVAVLPDVLALEAGKIVEVSEEVVQKVRLGERELERRRRRSKAAKAARKHNR